MVGPTEKKITLDWSKLPPHLSYLAEPSERYGEIQFENQIMEFLDQEATAADLERLRKIKFQLIRDEVEIIEWIDQLGITEHREAALVYFLLHLVALGVDSGHL